MKKTAFIGFIIMVCISTSRSQTNDIKRGFYDCKLSYAFSAKETDNFGNYSWGINAPYGIGISSSFRFNKSFFAEIGLSYKTDSKKKEYFTFTFVNQKILMHEYQYSSIDLPLQLHFNFFNHKAIHLYACAGLKGTLSFYHDDWNPYYDDNIINSDTHEYRIAYSLGLLESFDLTKKIGLFSSQNFGHYFANKAKATTFYYTSTDVFFENMVDFRIGLTYKI